MRGLTKRSKFAIGALAAAAILQAVGLALSPAQAQQTADAVSRVLAVIDCTSADACSGRTNSGVYGHDDSIDGGKACVRFDPAYANMIDQGFEVMENPGGHSSIPFGYRIVAKPYGVDAARLPMSVQPPMPARIRTHPSVDPIPHPVQ